MSFIDGKHPAPFGSITIYRATATIGDAVARLHGALFRRAATTLEAFSPSQLEDIGLSVADMPSDRRPGFFARFAAAVRERNARRRTILELERLTDGQLADIGLNRAYIEDLRSGKPLI